MDLLSQLELKTPVSRLELAQCIATYHTNKNIFLDVFTRTGKSIMSIELVKNWEGKILILCPNTLVLGQWKENLEKYNPDILERVDLFCYQSLHKIPRNAYQIILCDEWHLVTPARLKHLKDFTPDHWIGMSGTVNSEDLDVFRDLTRTFFTVRIGIEQAVFWGIIPAPVIYKVPIEFDNTKTYLTFEKGKNKKLRNQVVPFFDRWESIKNRKVNTVIQCTEAQYNFLIEEEFSYWRDILSQFDAPDSERTDSFRYLLENGLSKTVVQDNLKRKGLARKKFYASLKTRHLRTLLKQLGDRRVIIFCNDIKQADMINMELSIHSNKDNPMEMIQNFNEKKTNMITCVNLLDMGVDLSDVHFSIILQLSGSDVASNQKFARNLLSDAPKTIILYFPKTQDEVFLNNFLSNFKEEWILERKL